MSEPIPLGKLAEPDARRDAVHVAIAPVQAGELLAPGECVGLDYNGFAKTNVKHLGIVDPFLAEPVKAGQWLYLCLFPNTVTGMRHAWLHPSFSEEK